MQKFQELLTEAAQLKQSQLKNQRKNFQSLPEYLKSGLNYAKKYKQLRQQCYMLQMTISEKLKKQGNQLFVKQQYPQALTKYQQSLAIFRFIDAKSYDNMKDEDLIYNSYSLPESDKNFEEQYKTHLTALYLNICSSLTKVNKKEDALHSADQALKIKETAKAFYKKAQVYLQYINKETPDIKLGFYYLNKSYEISKDPTVVQQMHKIKKQIDEERDKQKKWFKFMFDKNSQAKPVQNEVLPSIKDQQKIITSTQKIIQKCDKNEVKKAENLKSFQKQKSQATLQKQDQRLQKTKQKLAKYTNVELSDQQWIQQYEGEFISKNGSKIYSIIQLYGYKQYLGQYKSLLAQCLEFKRQQDNYFKRKQLYARYFQWLRSHPIDKIQKYIERYDLQIKWISQQRSNNSDTGVKTINQEDSDVKKQILQIKNQEQVVDQKIQLNEKIIQNAQSVQELIANNINNEQITIQPKLQEQQRYQKEQTQEMTQQSNINHQNQRETVQQLIHKPTNMKLYSFLVALAIIILIRFIF